MNDLLLVIDNGSTSILNLLDLSSAFDTIDHNLLLDRLWAAFGISDTVLEWFRSYLYNRKQIIRIDNKHSKEFPLTCGVPQGSVLGPILFILYISPVYRIFDKYNLSFHQFADDTQIYNSDSDVTFNEIAHNSEECVKAVKGWMDRNRLKLNDDKTESIKIGSVRNVSKIDMDELHFGSTSIRFVEKAKNLGVIIDSELGMKYQTTSLIRTLTFTLKKIRSIRPFLTVENAKQLVTSLLLSKLDYCNSLLAGVSKTEIQRLQVIQNNAARLIFRKNKFDSAKPLLKILHWLPVHRRIDFKIAVLVFKTLEGTAPNYLRDLLTVKTHPRVLRSSLDSTKLLVPRTKRTAGDRAFAVYGPKLWNSLPNDIRELPTLPLFKKHLKTYLFSLEFLC